MTFDQERYYRYLNQVQQRQNTLRCASKLLAQNITPKFSTSTPAVAGSSKCNCTIADELMNTVVQLQSTIIDLYSEINTLNSKLQKYENLSVENSISSMSSDISSLSIFVQTQTPNGQLQILQDSINELSGKVMNLDIEFTDGGDAEDSGGPDNLFD